jgi:hypothetical protein
MFFFLFSFSLVFHGLFAEDKSYLPPFPDGSSPIAQDLSVLAPGEKMDPDRQITGEKVEAYSWVGGNGSISLSNYSHLIMLWDMIRQHIALPQAQVNDEGSTR